MGGCNRNGGEKKAPVGDVAKEPVQAAKLYGGIEGPVVGTVVKPAKVDATTWASRDLLKVIDVGTLPVIEGSDVRARNAVVLDVDAPGKLDEVLGRYIKALTARGWKQFEPAGSRPVNDEYGSVHFRKNGHVIKVDVSATKRKDEPRVLATIRLHGDLDTRDLPRPAGAEVAASAQIGSSYFSKNSVADEAAWIARTFQADGWQPYSRFDSHDKPSPDFATLLLRKRGYSLGVFIAKSPLAGKATNVSYHVEALAHELPVPPTATKVQLDDAGWKLRAEVPGNFPAAVKFFEKAMVDAGYAPIPGEKPQETYHNLRFATDAGDIVMVQAFSKDGKTTSISMEGIPVAVVERGFRQIEKANRPTELAPPPPKAILASDVPLPGSATDVKIDAAGEQITFNSPSEISTLVTQLRARLAAAGWQEDMTSAVVERRNGMLVFRHGPATLTVTLANEGKGTQTTMGGVGLTWPSP